MSRLLTFLLFGLGFVVLPFGVSPFETPKIVVAELAVVILLGAFLWQKDRSIIDYPFERMVVIGAILALSLVDLIVYRGEGFWGNSFRLQGVFLLWLLATFSVISSRVSLLRLPKWLLIGLLMLHLLAAVFIQVPNVDRAVGTLGEPNALAAYIIFLWPFLLFSNSKSKFLTSLGIGLAGLIIFLSGSRSGLVAFLIQLIFVLLNQIFRMAVGKITLICVCLVMVSLLLPFLDQRQEYENRSEIWTTAFVAGFYHPLLGAGFGNTQKLLMDARAILGVNREFQVIDSSHNLWLDFWVQGGVVALVLITSLVALTLRDFVRFGNKLAIILLLGAVAVAMFNPLSIVSLVQFWWLMGWSRISRKVSTSDGRG